MSGDSSVGFRRINEEGKVETLWVGFGELMAVSGLVVCKTLEATDGRRRSLILPVTK